MTLDDTEFIDRGTSATSRDSAPWFLGEAPVPVIEPKGVGERAGMLAELERLPFLVTVRHLLDFVGERRRLTKQGELFAVDRRELERLLSGEEPHWSVRRYDSGQTLHLAWKTLLDSGVLIKGDGQVRPDPSKREDPWDPADPEQPLTWAQSLVEAALETALTSREFTAWTVIPEEHLMDALLIASGPDGLLLPTLPRGDHLVHCDEVVDFMSQLVRHPWSREVPLDHLTGHPSSAGLQDLLRTVHQLEWLDGCGLLTSLHRTGEWEGDGGAVLEYDYSPRHPPSAEAVRYRVPVAMRSVLARVGARLSDETASGPQAFFVS